MSRPDSIARGVARLVLTAFVALPVAVRAQAPTDLDRVLHVLNRTSFGPDQDEADALLAGAGTLDAKLNTYLDTQMNPLTPESGPLLTALGTLEIAAAAQGDPGSLAHLQKSFLLRATCAELQLRELMTLFWERHFNTAFFVVQSGLSQVGAESEDYTVWFEREENDYFREHAFGDFRDLLGYSATNLPMLIYLNGATTVAGSVNENHARELLELHTMGPATAGGTPNYDQGDIQLVAQVLTGWRVAFDPGPPPSYSVTTEDGKHVDFMGQQLTLFSVSGSPMTLTPATTAPKVVKDTDSLLDKLVRRDATRDFVIRKLMAFFYGDEAAKSVNDPVYQPILDQAKVAWGFRGDMQAVLDVLLRAPVFLDASLAWSRVRTPVEQICWLPRACGAGIHTASVPPSTATEAPWLAMLRTPESLFMFPSPDGYPIESGEQLGAQAYIDRVSFGKLPHDEFANYVNFYFTHDYFQSLVDFQADMGTPAYKQSGVAAPYLLQRFFGTAFTPAEQALVVEMLDKDHLGNPSPLSAVPDDIAWAKRMLAAIALIGGLPRASTK